MFVDAFSIRMKFGGHDDGTRNFVVAGGCAYPGDYSAVAVFRTLTGEDASYAISGSVVTRRCLIFFIWREWIEARFFADIPL